MFPSFGRRSLPLSSCVLAAIAARSEPAAAQELLHRFDGHGGSFGVGLRGAGDLDGDGVGDVLVGEYGNDAGGTDSGALFAYSGSTGQLLFSVTGDAAGDWFGRSLAGVGDLDGDGLADLVVGAAESDQAGTNAGLVRVLSAKDRSVIFEWTGAAGEYLGWRVSGASDVDGDGVPDVAVSAHDHTTQSKADRVAILSGKDGSVLRSYLGQRKGHTLGTDLADLGDLDQDGVPDLLVSAAFDDAAGTDAGSVRVYGGATGAVLLELFGEAAGDRFGLDLDAAGDVDRDGFVDLLIGANGSDANGTDSGKGIVVSGRDSSTLYEFVGAGRNASLGNCAGAGDMNGDGFADVVLGSPGTTNGLCEWVSGLSGDVLFRVEGEVAGDFLGRTLTPAGDLDGDGLSEFLVSAPTNAAGGSVFVYRGNDLYLSSRTLDPAEGDLLRIDTRGGTPKSPAALFVTEWNGTPLFQRVALDRLNQVGNWRFSATVPPGLAGSSLVLRSYAVDPGGALADSRDLVLSVR